MLRRAPQSLHAMRLIELIRERLLLLQIGTKWLIRFTPPRYT